ncbi:nitronate monooxygenase [Halopseudomonas nanhaiensis]|uniref:NAD(P)H-dependent flavin oxidoreductase n=1 Tax=Halopseudomonas nanhaiensis TaxID=2830842 RepID=UPI001CBC609B|nr:nitronate monooxygenase [Halopseudomonas nanhaiensis]UAW98441.1 nitronate monooxygenase [Halopseudomonas nanhaiensis]
MTRSNPLGTRIPLIQAPMAGVQGSALALEVCRAGALGSLPAAMLGPEALEQELSVLAAQSTGPWSANFFCHASPQPDAAASRRWREALSPYYDEYGIAPDAIAPGAARRPFDADALALLERYRPAVVSFHFGLPDATLLDRIKALGILVLSSATTVAEARWLEAHGADVIIAQGLEAGGHRGMFLEQDLTGQLGTLALVPQVVDAVRLPVVAAGGIADTRGIRAALALGACAVQLGTAYLLCPECTTSSVHRAALAGSGAEHTVLTNVFSGRPARGIVNRVVREVGPMSSAAPAFPLATAGIAPLRSAAEKQGRGDFSPLWSGQNASGCRAVSAYQLTCELSAAFAL